MDPTLEKAGFANAGQVKLALLKAGVKLSAQGVVDAITAHDKPGVIRLHTGEPALGPVRNKDCGFEGATGQVTANNRIIDLDDYERQQGLALGSYDVGHRLSGLYSMQIKNP